jgi:hypothetical protein
MEKKKSSKKPKLDTSAVNFSFNNELLKNSKKENWGVFIGTPCTGLVRMEWAMARFGQIIPCNWGYRQAVIWMTSMNPLGFLVPDAQNLIVKRFIEDGKTEWLALIEQDNVIPPDFFLRLNDYMRNRTVPIVSGLYYTKSEPAEPMVYRGRSNSYYKDWKIGDKVWCDAVPTGSLMIHRSILEVLWNESEEYVCGTPPQVTRRVFSQPQYSWQTPSGGWETATGTSDMEFCSRIIVQDVFKRAGWPKYSKKQYPFLVDTGIFVGHIDNDGRVFPSAEEKKKWMKGCGR